MPFISVVKGDIIEADHMNLALKQGVLVFSNDTDRGKQFDDAKVTPTTGMQSYLTDTNTAQTYQNGVWVTTSNIPSTRQIIAGTGLTGGGDLSADCTIDFGIGAGLTATANAVAVAYAPHWTTARKITLTGAVTGFVSIDGKADVSLPTAFGGVTKYTNQSTIAAGWSRVVDDVVNWGPLTFVTIEVKRTGAKIAFNTTGNVTDTLVFSLTTAVEPEGNWWINWVGSATDGGAQINNAGDCRITSGNANSSIDTNHYVRFSAAFSRDIVLAT